MVTWLLLAILLGLIPAAIAQGKGYDFVGWWFYGSALFIVALPHALMLQPNEKTLEHRQVKRGRRKCPFCAEMILGEAKVCRFCGRDVPPIEAPGVEASAGDPSPVPLDERHYTGRFNCPGCGAGRPYEGSVDIDDGTSIVRPAPLPLDSRGPGAGGDDTPPKQEGRKPRNGSPGTHPGRPDGGIWAAPSGADRAAGARSAPP